MQLPIHLHKILNTTDPDYVWEMELDEILKLPNYSYELDSAITQFLLLPLYFATHQHLDSKGFWLLHTTKLSD
jgi:hypothetical protein